MNEQLQLAVTTLIQTSITAFEKGSIFLSEQIPDVIYQLLLWTGISSFLHFFLAGILFSAVLIYVNIKQVKWWLEEVPTKYSDTQLRIYSEFAPCALLNPLQLGFLGIIVPALQNVTWLQILIAPKLFLIEYAKTFI